MPLPRAVIPEAPPPLEMKIVPSELTVVAVATPPLEMRMTAPEPEMVLLEMVFPPETITPPE